MAALPVGAELPLYDKTLQLLQLAPEDPHSPSRFIVSSVSRDFDMRDPNAVLRLVTINTVNGAGERNPVLCMSGPDAIYFGLLPPQVTHIDHHPAKGGCLPPPPIHPTASLTVIRPVAPDRLINLLAHTAQSPFQFRGAFSKTVPRICLGLSPALVSLPSEAWSLLSSLERLITN